MFMQEIEEYQGTLTSKGQVTLPRKIRQLLGVKPHDRVVFRVSEGKVELQPATMTLEQTFGAVKPLKSPEDFKELRDKAIEEHTRASID
jgi:AbrB family looped-hinge helix DNA binding protein